MNPVNRLPLEQVEIELKFRTSSIFFVCDRRNVHKPTQNLCISYSQHHSLK